ncbi:zinc-dependent alcohol dehydrogenase family protein [Denitratisoma sp. agr-D3]
MAAMVLRQIGQPLVAERLPVPQAAPGTLLIRVEACGICRTDLHLVDGELPDPRLPIVPGHEIVGRVSALGAGVTGFVIGQRVGVPWLGWTCGQCAFCRSGRENLCDAARFTGYQLHGGYAEYTVADARYCFPLPEGPSAASLAPLLCAGLIGYRALRLAEESAGTTLPLGLYGFGAAAHIVAQVLKQRGRPFYAFTRPGDVDSQAFARQLGAAWAGGTDATPPGQLAAALIFAPAGNLVPHALGLLEKGGCVVCAGIHMSDIPSFPYAQLWGERMIRSVANLTRRDGEEFLALAATFPLHTEVTPFPLIEANTALARLRSGALQGAAVLTMAG